MRVKDSYSEKGELGEEVQPSWILIVQRVGLSTAQAGEGSQLKESRSTHVDRAVVRNN